MKDLTIDDIKNIRLRPKITDYTAENKTVEDLADQHFKKLTYGEELQRQMEEKKRK